MIALLSLLLVLSSQVYAGNHTTGGGHGHGHAHKTQPPSVVACEQLIVQTCVGCYDAQGHPVGGKACLNLCFTANEEILAGCIPPTPPPTEPRTREPTTMRPTRPPVTRAPTPARPTRSPGTGISVACSAFLAAQCPQCPPPSSGRLLRGGHPSCLAKCILGLNQVELQAACGASFHGRR